MSYQIHRLGRRAKKGAEVDATMMLMNEAGTKYISLPRYRCKREEIVG
jgi:hypothetical protein